MRDDHGQAQDEAMSLRPSGSTAGYGRLVDIEAVAAQLGVHIRHVRRLVHERRIPYVKWGHLLRFDPAEIDAWIDRARVPAGPAEPQLDGRRR